MARVQESNGVSTQAPSPGRTFLNVVTHPNVDRTIATLAIVPFIYTTYVRYTQGLLNIPRASAVVASLLLIGTMVIRRPPIRVTPNPWYWLLAFVATYGTLGPTLFSQRGVPLAPNVITDGLALLSLGITAFARFSLGKNIGFVPAQRQLVTNGAYAHVRHPIYTGIFVAYAGLVLRAYSPLNLSMVVVVSTLFMIKSVVEENFLKADPVYAEYMRKVRWRWIPGIV